MLQMFRFMVGHLVSVLQPLRQSSAAGGGTTGSGWSQECEKMLEVGAVSVCSCSQKWKLEESFLPSTSFLISCHCLPLAKANRKTVRKGFWEMSFAGSQL